MRARSLRVVGTLLGITGARVQGPALRVQPYRAPNKAASHCPASLSAGGLTAVGRGLITLVYEGVRIKCATMSHQNLVYFRQA